MKKIALLILPLLLIISCENDDSFPKTESITSGTKWTLQIGSAPAEVYSQLQKLGLEKKFQDVDLLDRKALAGPEEIKSDLSLYRAITLEAPSERIERILIQFDQNKVQSLEKGGALLDNIEKWPENLPYESTIHVNDPIEEMQQKLFAIYQNPLYENYKILLSGKWLEKPFDLEMANYDEWHFAFNTSISSSKSGISSVHLLFKNGKLSKILHHYNEGDIMN